MQPDPPILIQNFTRKSFPVEAVKVTRANMSRVAEWCGGSVGSGENFRSFIWIRGKAAHRHKRLNKAYVGDWVVKSENSFKFYPKQVFDQIFEANLLVDIRKEIDLKLTKASLVSVDTDDPWIIQERLGVLAKEIVELVGKQIELE